MKNIFSAFAFVFLSFAVCAEESKDCPSPPKVRKTFPVPSTKPNIHELTLYCGSATATQSTDAPKTENSKRDGHSEPTPLEKLLEAIAKILSSVAWPIAAVFIAHYFKKELATLLARLKKLKAGAAEAEFAEQLKETEEEVAIERTPEAQSVTAAAIESAAENPRGTILSAWLEVETAIQWLCEVKGLNRPAARPTRGVLPLMRDIQRAEILDVNYVALFHDLRSLRNDAAHNPDFNPSAELVVRYVQLARELTSALKKAAIAANPSYMDSPKKQGN